MLPPFDFYETKLSLPARKQLAGIYSHRDSGRSVLLGLIAVNVYDPDRGVFLPVSDVTFGKEFHESRNLRYKVISPLQRFPRRFFSNALIAHDAFEHAPPRPSLCATNASFLVITIEVESGDAAVFEETLRWTRTTDGKFSTAPFAAVDKRLTEYKDYRGFTVLFSGNKSLHFDFVFETAHLENAPHNVGPKDRLASVSQHSAVMHAAAELIWDSVTEAFNEIIPFPAPLDRRLRSLTQWRRAPWAVRTLDEA